MLKNLFKARIVHIYAICIAIGIALIPIVCAAAAGPPCNPTNMITPIRTAYGYDGGRTPETADTVFQKSKKFESHDAVCIEPQDLSSPLVAKGLLWVWYAKEAREYLIVRKEWRLLDSGEYTKP